MEQPRFGKWTVIGSEGRHRLVQCECGTRGRALPFDLRTGKTTMCRSCKADAKRGVPRPEIQIHGLADSPTQWVWSDMKRRCMEPGRRGYENYGGRGIKVCDRWITGDGARGGFECFVADLGERPSKDHQLERADNDGDYTPANCSWVPRREQDYNKRNTFRFEAFGRQLTLLEAEQAYGLPRATIWRRIHRGGMHPEVALTQPLRVTAR